MIAELRLSESHNVKKQGAIRAVLAKHNVPAESFSEITAKGVKRLVDNFEDNPEFVKDLMAAAPLKHSQRFGAFVSR